MMMFGRPAVATMLPPDRATIPATSAASAQGGATTATSFEWASPAIDATKIATTLKTSKSPAGTKSRQLPRSVGEWMALPEIPCPLRLPCRPNRIKAGSSPLIKRSGVALVAWIQRWRVQNRAGEGRARWVYAVAFGAGGEADEGGPQSMWKTSSIVDHHSPGLAEASGCWHGSVWPSQAWIAGSPSRRLASAAQSAP